MRRKKKLRTILKVLFPLSVLSLVPILMSATGEVNGDQYQYKVIVELKEGSTATQTSDDVLSLSSNDFYQLLLSDNAGLSSLLTLVNPNIQLELFKKSAASAYNSIVSTQRTSVESQRATYISQFGAVEGERLWQQNLRTQNYDSTEDFIYKSSRQNALNAAFVEIYKTRSVTETDDKNTPDDTTDDTTQTFNFLGNNQLYWVDYWYKRSRPIHVGQISFPITANADYKVVETTPGNLTKLSQFLDILKVQGADTATDPINFSGLAAFSTPASTTGGNLGIATLTNNIISDPIARNNVYSFINDSYNGVDVTASIIDLSTITDGQSFLNLFSDGNRNYKILRLRGGQETFVVSRTASGFSIFRISGFNEFINSATRTGSYKDYFLSSIRNFNDLTTKPFDIAATLNAFITTIPNNYFSLASNNNLITFDNGNLISGQDLEANVNSYLSNIQLSNTRGDYERFVNALETLNETYLTNDNTSQIDDARLQVLGNWGVWA